MKKSVSKSLVFILAGLALLCFVLSFALFKKTARAETAPAAPCTGDHSGWEDIKSMSETDSLPSTLNLQTGNYYLSQNVKTNPSKKRRSSFPKTQS